MIGDDCLLVSSHCDLPWPSQRWVGTMTMTANRGPTEQELLKGRVYSEVTGSRITLSSMLPLGTSSGGLSSHEHDINEE